jgi:hypothetical protein
MAELQISLAGVVVPFETNDAPTTPFTAVFDVDTLTGTQGLQYDNGMLSVFQSFGTHFTNLDVTVGGNPVLSTPADNGELWGNTTIANAAWDSGVILPNFSVEWMLGPPLVSQGTADPIAAALLSGIGGAHGGSISDLWSIVHFTSATVTVLGPSPVPEPAPIGLFAIGLFLLALVYLRGARQRTA